MRPVNDLARTEPARPVYARPEGGDASVSAVAAPALGSMRWIMDTGSGYDLIARSHLTPDDEDFVEPTKAVPLYTANGWTRVTERCSIQNPTLFQEITPLVMDASPPVLTVGRRCMEQGYAFHWTPGVPPVLVRPDGVRIQLEVENYVPYLADVEDPMPPVAPAVPAETRPSRPAPIPAPHPPAPVPAGGDAAGPEGGGAAEPVRDLKAEATSTVVESARRLLSQARLPPAMWPNAVRHF